MSVVDIGVRDSLTARIAAGIDCKYNKRVGIASHRREVLKGRTGLDANQIAMSVAHMDSEAINTNNKAHRRKLKAEAIKIISDL